jgi:hypothetical protein
MWATKNGIGEVSICQKSARQQRQHGQAFGSAAVECFGHAGIEESTAWPYRSIRYSMMPFSHHQRVTAVGERLAQRVDDGAHRATSMMWRRAGSAPIS